MDPQTPQEDQAPQTDDVSQAPTQDTQGAPDSVNETVPDMSAGLSDDASALTAVAADPALNQEDVSDTAQDNPEASEGDVMPTTVGEVTGGVVDGSDSVSPVSVGDTPATPVAQDAPEETSTEEPQNQ